MQDEMPSPPVTAEDQTYAELRPRLFGIAYRMLGSVGEAEDVVQEAMLRLHRAVGGGTAIESPEAFLTTVTTRIAIDELRSARVRRETYVGPWLPDPLVADRAPDVGQRAEEAESVSMAFLVLLERLSPVERAAWLLRDVFDYSFDEIARIVERSPANVRQIVVRARRAIEAERPRFETSPERRDELARRFMSAAQEGDMDGLLAVLSADVTFTGDGGDKGSGLPRPMVGAERVARFMLGLMRAASRLGVTVEAAEVNGQPGLVTNDPDGRIISVMSMVIADGAVQAIDSVVNPDKLTHLGPVSDLGRRAIER